MVLCIHNQETHVKRSVKGTMQLNERLLAGAFIFTQELVLCIRIAVDANGRKSSSDAGLRQLPT